MIGRRAKSEKKMDADFKSSKQKVLKENLDGQSTLQKAEESKEGLAKNAFKKNEKARVAPAAVNKLKAPAIEAKKSILSKDKSLNEVEGFKTQLRLWLTANEKDKNISSVVTHLLGLKSSDFSLEPSGTKEDALIKVYLLNKNV